MMWGSDLKKMFTPYYDHIFCCRVLQTQNILDLYLVIQTPEILLVMCFGVLLSQWYVFHYAYYAIKK